MFEYRKGWRKHIVSNPVVPGTTNVKGYLDAFKANGNGMPMKECSLCGKPFEESDIPYFAWSNFGREAFCKDCADKINEVDNVKRAESA